jgi:CheY-like chemotaxis protein
MGCIEILVVDQNPNSAMLVEEFFRQRYAARVTLTRDGEEALNAFEPEYMPDLIVLDLDHPSKLAEQQSLVRIRRKIGAKVPIVVMSSSQDPEDVSEAYADGANAYMIRPSKGEALRAVLQVLARLWIEPLRRTLEASR